MSAVYVMAVAAFCTVMLALLAEAVMSVARDLKPRCLPGELTATERRRQDLPFIGAERRRALMVAAQRAEENKRKAA